MSGPEILTDSFGRQITYLRISVTDRCNYRCIYCMPESGVPLLNHADIISYEDILRLVDILSHHGVYKIRITGGEPLARKGIISFIKSLKEINGIKDIALTTNGSLLEKYATQLYEAGLKRINISLDSLKEERFNKITRTGSLKDVLKGIELAKDIGFHPLKINTVLIRGLNDDEIIDFVNFAKKFELNLRFIEYMPIGGNISDAISSKEIEKKIRTEFYDFKMLGGEMEGSIGVSRSFGFKDSGAIIGFISPLSQHFCGNCNRLRLTASGNLRPCLFYDDEYNIKDILKEKDDGAVFEEILNIVKLKLFKHKFNEKVADKKALIGAVEFMNKIGG